MERRKKVSYKQFNQVLSEISEIQAQMGAMTSQALKVSALALEKKQTDEPPQPQELDDPRGRKSEILSESVKEVDQELVKNKGNQKDLNLLPQFSSPGSSEVGGQAEVIPEMSEKIKDLKLNFEEAQESWYARTLTQVQENQLRKAASESAPSSVISMTVQGDMVFELSYGTHGEVLRVLFGKDHIQVRLSNGAEFKIPRT